MLPHQVLDSGSPINLPTREARMAPIDKRHDHNKVCIPTIMLAVVLPCVLIFGVIFMKWLRPKHQSGIVGGGGRLPGGGPWPGRPWLGMPPRSLGDFGGFGGRYPGEPSRPVRSSSGTRGLGPSSPRRPSSHGRPPSRPPSAYKPPSRPRSSRKPLPRTPSRAGSRAGSSRAHERDGIPLNAMYKGEPSPSPRT